MASAPATPVEAATPAPSTALGGGLGQEALAHPSSLAVWTTASSSPTLSAPADGAGGGRGQAAPVIPSPFAPVAADPGVGHPSVGLGSPQPPLLVSAPGFTREEVVAFGGIPDPVSTGRRMCARIHELPEVDDMQQRCAMRATKLQETASSSGFIPNYGSDPFLVATHPDGGQRALGYWVFSMGDGSSGYLNRFGWRSCNRIGM